MFGLFKSQPHDDATLGRLVRSWGHWRGAINLDGKGAIPLVIAGSRTAPNAKALDIARRLPALLNELRPAIERELFEHCFPYLEAIRSGELPEPACVDILAIVKPEDTWAFIKLKSVTIKPFFGVLATEVALDSAWDIEHTLGAYIRDGRIIELNGSV